jgi:hypothetical protein
MPRLTPERCRKAADRCRQQALSHENSNERVRFSLAWDGVASMSERLQAMPDTVSASFRFGHRRGDAIAGLN